MEFTIPTAAEDKTKQLTIREFLPYAHVQMYVYIHSTNRYFTPKKMHILPKPKSVLVVPLIPSLYINLNNIRSKI